MNISELIKKDLQVGRVLQVATAKNNQPWICTVFYVSDDNYAVYWVSEDTRRHSQELAGSPKAAAAVCLKGRPEDPPVGLQMEGLVSIVDDADQKKLVLDLFMQRNGSTQDWVDKVLASDGGRKIYKLQPSFFAIFDPSIEGGPRIEWQPKD